MHGTIHSRIRIASGLAGLIFCSAAAATSGVLPPSHEQNGIWYVSGGYGCHEAAAMRKAAAGFPLSISFYAQGVERRLYLAKVHVAIRDAADAVVFDVEAEGPILLVRLPAGRYRVDADYKGEHRSTAVDIDAGAHRQLAITLHDEAVAETQASVHERELCA
ncbi:carboxypeptidase regulatory-like domain-containing protein [Solimonas soli]|uniref:carboxypeptidase regulatory-like domain-containing protein n=1 Tax=Solimonas soli TaxID=413479 RepID=UPI0004BB21F1|nr:carboxypeptidase regulatory-like domain-containing protein [Solimonas soli]